MSAQRGYPARADAELAPDLSRWLWLVKWLLAVPHYICLAFLWVAFVVVEVVAFFAILFTGRFPRALFDFNVGVLRWAWRVAYYTTAAFGTDRYPPFSLQDDPTYPAHFDVDYPQRLSRGLVLVKWWLLAIPHYIIVGILVGGGTLGWTVYEQDGSSQLQWTGGLISVLTVVAAVILLFTGTYPRSLFDVVLGFDRWVLRVAAYGALMTDEYPPFRLDLGGQDPGTAELLPPGVEPGVPLAAPGARAVAGPTGPTGPVVHRWTGGRVVSLVVGSLLVLVSTGPLVGGVALSAADRIGRTDGYLTSSEAPFSSGGRALTSQELRILPDVRDSNVPADILGTIRFRATSDDLGRALFVGIGPTADVRAWLANTRYTTVSSFAPGTVTYVEHTGTATPAAPGTQSFWAASVSGNDRQTLTWKAQSGDWTLVVLNADVSPGVAVTADVGATVPALGWFAAGLVVLGLVLLVGGVLFVVLAVRAAGHGPSATPPAAAPQEPTVVG